MLNSGVGLVTLLYLLTNLTFLLVLTSEQVGDLAEPEFLNV
jgi:hypothetical protein